MVWMEVEEALDAILDEYERVNHVISLFQDEKSRRRGLELLGPCNSVGLELGTGPGNFTSGLSEKMDGPLIGVDFSSKMLHKTKSRLDVKAVSLVRGVFESLPFRSGSLGLTAASYALRDAPDKGRVLREVSRVLGKGGRFLIVDVGKPSNTLMRRLFTLYMRIGVPILGGLAGGYGYRNPWGLLPKTYEFLYVNNILQDHLRSIFGSARLEEYSFGAIIVALAEKTDGTGSPI